MIDSPGGDWAPASPTGHLIHDTLTARLHPGQACAALAAAIRARGGAIVPEGRAEGQIVHATGWQGLEEMTARHTRLVGAGIKGQAVLLDHDAAAMPQLFVDGLHIVPHADGTVAVGSTTEREFDSPDETDAQCDALLASARAAVPALAEAREIRRWAGVRPRSRTRAPMLGRHPFRDGEFWPTAGSRSGSAWPRVRARSWPTWCWRAATASRPPSTRAPASSRAPWPEAGPSGRSASAPRPR